LGVLVETIQPADLGDLRDYYALSISILEAITTAGLPRSTRVYRCKLNVNGRDVAYSLQKVYPGLATLCGYL
jgi:hypothetical protein